jgi:hypothetical protein
MTRFLLASDPAALDVAPLLRLAGDLVARGHEVFCFTGRSHRTLVEAAGAYYCPATADLERHIAQIQPHLVLADLGGQAAVATIAERVPLPWGGLDYDVAATTGSGVAAAGASS